MEKLNPEKFIDTKTSIIRETFKDKKAILTKNPKVSFVAFSETDKPPRTMELY